MFPIDKGITTTYPGTKMGILIMREVSYSGSYSWTTPCPAVLNC